MVWDCPLLQGGLRKGLYSFISRPAFGVSNWLARGKVNFRDRQLKPIRSGAKAQTKEKPAGTEVIRDPKSVWIGLAFEQKPVMPGEK